jgi:anti-sigma-K factor RskA
MTHDELKDALPAYALDALDAAERAAVEAHLLACESCRAELIVLQRVADGIGLEAPPVTPPPSLKGRVLGSIPARATDSLDAWRQLPRAAPPPAAPRRRSWLLPLAAAASVAVAAAAMYYANAQRSALSSLARDRQQMERVMAAPDVLQVQLKPQAPGGTARARAYWSRTAGMVFVAENLPILSRGQVYQLWTITGTAAASAGTLIPRPDGTAMIAVPIDSQARRPDAFGVTIEPTGGSPSPTLPIVMLGASGQ